MGKAEFFVEYSYTFLLNCVIMEGGGALTWRESLERACAARTETPTCHILHFAAILSHLKNCFFTPSRRFFPRFADVGGAS